MMKAPSKNKKSRKGSRYGKVPKGKKDEIRAANAQKERKGVMGTPILAVDDDAIFLDELGEVLGASGYRMTTVSDPMKAIPMARKVRPALVLLDLNMPGKTGFDLAREMKSVPELAEVPIVAMSGFIKEDDAPFVRMCNIRKLLNKPFNPLDIIWEIEHILKTGTVG